MTDELNALIDEAVARIENATTESEQLEATSEYLKLCDQCGLGQFVIEKMLADKPGVTLERLSNIARKASISDAERKQMNEGISRLWRVLHKRARIRK